jgi:hypothetical protein
MGQYSVLSNSHSLGEYFEFLQNIYHSWRLYLPEMGAGRCLGPKGNGVSLGEGSEVGPGPPRSEGDKQSVLHEGRDNMDKDEEERASWA